VSLRCSRRNARFEPVTDQNTYIVPASYGDCGVFVKGTSGATFDFYEHPDQVAQAVAPPTSIPSSPSP
jgi:hypothetical protein